MTKAFDKKAPVSACCSPSPVCLMLTSSGFLLKEVIYFESTEFTPVALYPWVVSTLERKVINLFSFFRFTLPSVFVGSTFTSDPMGICLMAPPLAISLKAIRMFKRLSRFWRCNSFILNWILYSSLPSFILETSFPNKAVRICWPICAEDTPEISARSRSTVSVISGLFKSISIFNSSTPGTWIESR